MPDLVSKAFIIGISEYEFWHRLPGAEKDAAHGLHVLSKDLGVETNTTTTLVGQVDSYYLHRGFAKVAKDLETEEHLPEFPVLLGLISCHAVQKGQHLFPHLIPSDAPQGEEAWNFAYDVETHFLERLRELKFRCKKVKKLRVILVFDCCREALPDSQHAPRGLPNCRNWMTSLKHDFYVIFSCDRGSSSFEDSSGGALLRVLLPSLKYAKPIRDIFLNASLQVGCQRPNHYDRPGLPMPVLGSQRGQPDDWKLDRDETGDDMSQVVVLVLSGITGHGKSSLGNTLTNQQKFIVGQGLCSETKSAEHVDLEVCGRTYRIIDTPGFNDTSLSAKEHWTRFAEFADRAPAGIDAFLHVVEWGRFNDDTLKALKCLQEVAGEGCSSYILLVFSKAPPDFHRQVPEASHKNQYLKQALETVADFTGVQCSVRYGEDKEAQQRILEKVKLLIDKNGRKHSNQPIQLANANRRELVEIVKLLHGSEAREARAVIQQVYNGSVSSSQALVDARDKLRRQQLHRDRYPSPSQGAPSQMAPVADSHQAVSQVLNAMTSVGGVAQARADEKGNLLPQLFVRAWHGAVHFAGEQVDKKVGRKSVEKLTEMGFPENNARLAVKNAKGNFDVALEGLLSESAH